MKMFPISPAGRPGGEAATTTILPSSSCSILSTGPAYLKLVPKSIPRFPSRLKLGSRSPGAAPARLAGSTLTNATRTNNTASVLPAGGGHALARSPFNCGITASERLLANPHDVGVERSTYPHRFHAARSLGVVPAGLQIGRETGVPELLVVFGLGRPDHAVLPGPRLQDQDAPPIHALRVVQAQVAAIEATVFIVNGEPENAIILQPGTAATAFRKPPGATVGLVTDSIGVLVATALVHQIPGDPDASVGGVSQQHPGDENTAVTLHAQGTCLVLPAVEVGRNAPVRPREGPVRRSVQLPAEEDEVTEREPVLAGGSDPEDPGRVDGDVVDVGDRKPRQHRKRPIDIAVLLEANEQRRVAVRAGTDGTAERAHAPDDDQPVALDGHGLSRLTPAHLVVRAQIEPLGAPVTERGVRRAVPAQASVREIQEGGEAHRSDRDDVTALGEREIIQATPVGEPDRRPPVCREPAVELPVLPQASNCEAPGVAFREAADHHFSVGVLHDSGCAVIRFRAEADLLHPVPREGRIEHAVRLDPRHYEIARRHGVGPQLPRD